METYIGYDANESQPYPPSSWAQWNGYGDHGENHQFAYHGNVAEESNHNTYYDEQIHDEDDISDEMTDSETASSHWDLDDEDERIFMASIKCLFMAILVSPKLVENKLAARGSPPTK